MYFNQNPNDNRDTQTNLNHSTYHYTGPELNGRERSGEPKPGFFQRRQGNGKAPKQKKTASGRFGAGSVVAIALAAALVGGGVGGVVGSGFGSSGGSTSVAVSDRTDSGSGGTEVSTTKVKAGDTMTSSQIYSTYGKSVVSVNVKTSNGEGAGTGFFISDDGYILTCHHVIDGATAISIVTQDSTSYEAEVVGSDSDLDTAVLKVKNADKKTTFPAVVLGDSSSLTVGDSVTAIGNALGTLANTLTTGVVSAKDRAISMSDGTAMKLLQTDCTVNSGNSGGPLFNSHGEVIGIVSAKYSSSASSSSASVEGLGFAIPMDDVADMVSELVTNGYVTGKPLMGISVGDVAEDVQAYGVPAGAAVKVVTPGLCGEKAGLQEGDIITKINDTEVASGNDLITAKDNYKPGDTVNLTVYRDGKTITVKLTLEESTPEKTAQQDQAQKEYEEQQQQQLQQEQQQGSGGWPFGGFGY